MKLKLFSLITAISLMFTFAGCGSKEVDVDISSTDSTSSQTVDNGPYLNPLTGLEIDSSAKNKRPVAIMVNNVSVAQGVQSGLADADIVYEAYAEGGITRLMAVFKDVNKIPRVGSIRSARYSYVDLALGHDAIYVHAGINESHCTPHVKETGIDNINLNSGRPSNYGMRISNGLSTEHTLYTTGEKLTSCFSDLNWRTELKAEETMWQSFNSASAPATLTDGVCTGVNIKMSAASTTKFVYDSTTKKYVRYSGSTAMKDYTSGKQFAFTNVLVLETDVVTLGNDGKYNILKTALDGGEGYYISNGTYQKIKWSKGVATNSLKLTLADGSECKLNAGNSWISFMNKEFSADILSE